MALAVFMRFIDATPNAQNPSNIDAKAEFVLAGQGVQLGRTVHSIITITALDTALTIRQKLSQSIAAQTSTIGTILAASDVLIPNFDRGLF
jgi:hypothetical protein